MKTKKSSNLQNGHAASPEAVIAKAKAAKKIVKLAREHVEMLRTEYKQARKALKQAKKASRRAKKEAKIAAKLLKNGTKKHESAKPTPARRATVAKPSASRARSTPAAIALPAQAVQPSGTEAVA